ncbi:hypothetical protein [Edwardsiella anguillarum]|uniref:Uncharacterized protein n=2 Tax=Edwardsiella TaxID=635 RepID=A0ABY8SM36_9GAMM|nr:hypothetical protein [Edwardsiella anguillarum]WHP85893.1 hypothetical protein MQ095_19815 [Edwardsiella anguillarum]WHP89701.1 hypothetical protein MQ088_19870 [Edwardsiella anguillarum]WHP93498.1 hypothetical protein MQ091_19855 [Edwardsiella anguillarum]WHP97288.1 hypothetical protein MQ096_19845 [Edwardsiella anguillarum]WHP97371.1 hypothetical protein MQ096_20405 [Edwardsiella anguillarum]
MRPLRQLSFKEKAQIVSQRILMQWFANPRGFALHLLRRFAIGIAAYNILLWFLSGMLLLSALVFNPVQFHHDFASLALTQSQADATYAVLMEGMGWRGIVIGLLFMAVVSWMQEITAEEKGV